VTRVVGLAVLVVAIVAALGAPVLAPHAGDQSFRGLLNAPPTRPHVRGDDGTWHRPFIYRWTLVNQLEQRYEEDRSARVPLAWLSGGRLVQSADEGRAPLLYVAPERFASVRFTEGLRAAGDYDEGGDCHEQEPRSTTHSHTSTHLSSSFSS